MWGRGQEGKVLASGSKNEHGTERGRVWPRALLASVLLALAGAPSSTESAIANGDTRTISFSNSHTNESGSFTYKLNGYYDPATLDKLNWFMRDWRLNEPTKMDPKLFDILWEVYRQSGSSQPIDVLSAYRSPHTNAMLRRRSRLVAEHSQHMEGKAIDAHFVDVGTAAIRDITMRMQAGGVGFYPIGSTPWVHVDSGSVRYWPRMTRDALTRLFPDGKTVFIPSDGEPLPGYELARAEIEARGGEVLTASSASSGLFGWLFGGPRGGGGDDAEEGGADNVVVSGRGGYRPATQVVSAAPDNLANARRNLPRGQTYMQPAPADAPPTAPAPAPAPKPEVVATADADTTSDAGPITLHGPIAAQFIAPLPPRKPSDLLADIVVTTPMPPPRPAEFAVASAQSKPAPAPAANADLIAALLERGKLPGEITRGVHSAPSSALALVDTNAAPETPERLGPLARAAALALPRPKAPAAAKAASAGVSSAARTPPPEAPAHLAVHGSVSGNPYGDLVVDAFNAPSAAPNTSVTTLADGLRGSGQ